MDKIEVYKNSKFRWFYLKDKNGKYVGCVASVPHEDTVAYSTSTLNPVDQWNRKTARSVAIGRLIHEIYEEKTYRSVTAGGDVKKTIMEEIATCVDLPTRLKEAARYWLSPKQQAKRKIHAMRKNSENKNVNSQGN